MMRRELVEERQAAESGGDAHGVRAWATNYFAMSGHFRVAFCKA